MSFVRCAFPQPIMIDDNKYFVKRHCLDSGAFACGLLQPGDIDDADPEFELLVDMVLPTISLILIG
jgi:hypothetical protein